MSTTLPEKILVVRLGAIGDVVNALVFATAVKDEAPATRIGWAVHPLAAPLVQGHPSVDRLHIWRRGTGLAGFRSLVREVRGERYDLAVDLQRIAKSSLLARLSGAPRVLGYDRRRAKEASWLLTKERIGSGPRHSHMVEQYLEFARHLGIREPIARRLLPTDPAADEWAEDLVQHLGAPPIVLNIGASKPENRWPPERFGQLAADCQRHLGAPVCLTGALEDQDAAARALGASGPGPRDLVGATTLRELAALAARARVFVACDTGPMHIAGAAGAPVVALFGPADARRTGPWGERAYVARVPPWNPAAEQRPARMTDLGTGVVLEAIALADPLGPPEGGTAGRPPRGT